MKWYKKSNQQNELEKIKDAIKNWDKKDIEVLFNLLYDAEEICQELEYEFSHEIDMSSLPVSDKFKDEVDEYSTYPIWACDDNGDCLVGESADSIENIKAIKNYYESKIKK